MSTDVDDDKDDDEYDNSELFNLSDFARILDSDGSQPSPQIDQFFEVKTYEIDGVPIQIREYAFSPTNSGTVWKSSFPLCKYILRHEAQFRGKRIVELGSGTGIASIFLKKKGFDITSSDIADDEVTENIRVNCQLNGVEVPHVPHLWGTEFPPHLNDFDVVIASDIILYENHYDELFATLKQLMLTKPDRSLCIMTYKRKAYGEKNFFVLLNQHGFQYETVGSKIWKIYPTRPPLMTWAARLQGPQLSVHPFPGPEAGGPGGGPGIVAHLRAPSKEAAETTDVAVTASGLAAGRPDDFVSAEGSRCWTTNEPFSWFCVDFGPERKVIASHYSLRYGSQGGSCCPRYWLLQGSDGFDPGRKYGHDSSPTSDADWHTLSLHHNDTSLQAGAGAHTWKVASRQAYRYFRVIQIGPNTYIPPANEDVWSQVFVVNGFEVYGALLRAPFLDVPQMPPVSASFYGNSDTVVPTTTIIRASPEVTRELQEALAALSERTSDRTPEKVKVVDIELP